MKMNAETKRKLRELEADELLAALEAQDDGICLGLTFAERIQMAVDEAHSSWLSEEIASMTKKAHLRYPEADVRQVDFSEERGIDRVKLAELASCGYVDRSEHIVFQGFAGSGKTYLSCAIAKEACKRRMSTFYTRMPTLQEQWKSASSKPGSVQRMINKLVKYQVLVLDEWLLNSMDKGFREMVMEVMEGRYGRRSTIFCTQYQQKDWHAKLGGGVNAEAIMDRIVHDAIWVETGEVNMRAKLSKTNKQQ